MQEGEPQSRSHEAAQKSPLADGSAILTREEGASVMNKPLRATAFDSKTVHKSLSGKVKEFTPSVPVNAVRPKPVILPKSNGK